MLRLGLADEVKTVGADDLQAQAIANISALGLPDIPKADVSEEDANEEDDAAAADEAEDEEARETFNLGVSEMLHSLFSKTFGKKKQQEEETTQTPQDNMKEDIQTTLQAAVNTAEAEERIAALEKENAELKAQLEALAAQDGDDTTANAGEASEATAENTLGNVREAYERLRGIL